MPRRGQNSTLPFVESVAPRLGVWANATGSGVPPRRLVLHGSAPPSALQPGPIRGYARYDTHGANGTPHSGTKLQEHSTKEIARQVARDNVTKVGLAGAAL